MDTTARAAIPPNRRRDKVQLSCSFCREKKLRCDRQKPCQRCVARGMGSSCAYPANSTPRPRAPAPRGATTHSLMKRLDRLEDTISSVIRSAGDRTSHQSVDITGKAKDNVSAPHTPASSESGSMHCTPKGTIYASSAHWTSIFDSISELRHRIGHDGSHSESPEQHDQLHPPQVHAEPNHLLSSLSTSATKEELLSALPERFIVDRHVFWYFNRLPLIFIHTPSFLRQYEAFWANPSDTSLLWLSLLYSILCLTPLDPVISSPAYQPLYLDRVIQCLVVGDYSRGGPYALEALYHYFVIEQSRQRDADSRNWPLYGLILRLALREGYHREPSRFSNITPFEGEMRRRLWMMLYAIDVMFSIQMGLPRMIKDEQCDTKFPRNLLDSDFDEDTTELPTSRPDTEITPILSWIVKGKIIVIIAMIADMSLKIVEDDDPCSSPSVKELDALLKSTYEQIPQRMKFTSLVGCLGASPEDIANRLGVSLLVQKGLIILHRQHVVCARPSAITGTTSSTNARQNCSTTCAGVAESVRTCTDAALKMLEYQDLIHHETQDGGALASLRWRLLSAPISHEFLMATSVLCSYVYRVYRGDPDTAGASTERIHAIENALSRTYGVWRVQTSGSKDAQRVTDTLGMLIGKLHDSDSGGVEGNGIPMEHQMGESQFGNAGELFYECFDLYGEAMNDFSSFIAW